MITDNTALLITYLVRLRRSQESAADWTARWACRQRVPSPVLYVVGGAAACSPVGPASRGGGVVLGPPPSASDADRPLYNALLITDTNHTSAIGGRAVISGVA